MTNIIKFPKTISVLALIMTIILNSCHNEIQPIEYGMEQCALCIMTVSDHRFGALLITDKGRRFAFDSAECLAHTYDETEDKSKIRHLLVTDYLNPEQLIDAKSAVYLQSKEMPSPMGMFINAFEDRGEAEKFLAEKGGRLLDWQEMVEVCLNDERPK